MAEKLTAIERSLLLGPRLRDGFWRWFNYRRPDLYPEDRQLAADCIAFVRKITAYPMGLPNSPSPQRTIIVQNSAEAHALAARIEAASTEVE